MSVDEQKLFVRSVKEIYAPLSARLSLNEIKNKMEDACFKFLEPEMYEQLSLDELEQNSLNGSKLVCTRAIKIAKENNIALLLKSSSSPNCKGTISNAIESQNILISSNSNLCEIIINFPNEHKIKLLSKNVFIWLKEYKLYNFDIENQKIKLLINNSDKSNILNILTKKLKI